MARFSVTIDSELPAAEAWRRVLDLRAHSAVIPLTTVRGDRLEAAQLETGSRFVARTGLGPLGYDDAMVVDEIEQPSVGGGGRARIRKEGKLIRGTIDVRVTPVGRSSSLDWSQQIQVRWVPRAFDPVVARVARAAYGRVLTQLLRRG